MEFVIKTLEDLSEVIAQDLGLGFKHVIEALSLLEEGNTIPFIARYRKEQTGSMADETLREVQTRYQELEDLEARKQTVFNTLNTLDDIDESVYKSVLDAKTLKEVEDLYRPYKPKRKTRASIAKAQGLEPLAQLIFNRASDQEVQDSAKASINIEVPEGVKPITTIEAAYQGASDILAEKASDDPGLRDILRGEMFKHGLIQSRTRVEEDSVYRLYYNYQEPINKIPSHRVLAINRGEAQEILSVSVVLEDSIWQRQMNHFFFVYKQELIAEKILSECAIDAYKRLLGPSLENEIRNDLKEKAQEESIKIFSQNLNSALMVPPLTGYTVLALDPGYRNGCKWAVVDPQGKHLGSGVIFPVKPFENVEKSRAVLKKAVNEYGVTLCVIGNGTAGRETEVFFAQFNTDEQLEIPYLMVDEAGASIYSATPLAQQELPKLDVNLRSAVSLARRVQDPLAELVKIDPWSIGVGQYQHDMNQKQLSTSLGGVVEDVVNRIGVTLNTASPSLLSYVSGINKTVASNIVAYREENGPFQSRAQLKKVSKLGPKVFEQCAGFLRVQEGKQPLDNTAVHPESYGVAKQLMETFDLKLGTKNSIDEKQLTEFAQSHDVGIETLNDIVEAISQPGRDIRDGYPAPKLTQGVMSIEDLKVGQVLEGVVRNVTAFGAFVDLGVHQDGLVHISQMADHFVKDPTTVVQTGQPVKVRVIDIDVEKKRISLSMKKN